MAASGIAVLERFSHYISPGPMDDTRLPYFGRQIALPLAERYKDPTDVLSSPAAAVVLFIHRGDEIQVDNDVPVRR